MEFFEITAYADGETSTSTQAQGTQTQANSQQANGPLNMIVSFLPIILIFVIFYFIAIRPQRKKEKETRAMIDALKVGDKVVTIGGICGKISKIKDNYVILETGNVGTPDEKSFVKMERNSIKSVETKQTN